MSMYDSSNVEIVQVRMGDTLVFFVDTDCYDLEDITQVANAVQQAFPNVKTVLVPEDMVTDIKIFRDENMCEPMMQTKPVDWDEMAERFTNGYGLTEIHP